MSTTTLDTIIEKARKQNRPLVISYNTAGFPDEKNFATTLKNLATHSDLIEIAIPFSDPVADSPTAERLELEAVKRGITLQTVFSALAELPADITGRLVLAGYYNNFLQYGFKRLATECQRFSITALVLYDVPIGENANLRAVCPTLRLIPTLAAATNDERLQHYAQSPAPYAYIVPAIGASGAEKALALCAETQKKAQAILKVPVGIRHDAHSLPENVKQALPLVWYESSLLEHLEKGKSVESFFTSLA